MDILNSNINNYILNYYLLYNYIIKLKELYEIKFDIKPHIKIKNIYEYLCYNTKHILIDSKTYQIRYYTLDNKLRRIENYKNNKYNGISKEWYSKDKINFIQNWKYGKRHGIFIKFKEDGNLVHIFNYLYDKKDGVQLEYDTIQHKYVRSLYEYGVWIKNFN
jgi:antitoxin component YwqK of YwqJK toxin-antitoxin module